MARINVFGLGYVGAVTAACLAQAGHEVLGVDANPQKVSAMESGRAPVLERKATPGNGLAAKISRRERGRPP